MGYYTTQNKTQDGLLLASDDTWQVEEQEVEITGTGEIITQ
jgi:hypothetical protein